MTPRPATSYAAACERIDALLARDPPGLHPSYRHQVLAHGRQTERVVVLLHGITSSPPQFRALGELFHSRGHNVFIPCLPRHGMADRMTVELASLTADELRVWMDEVIDIAQGLGERVKELALLHQVARLLHQDGMPPDGVLRAVAALLPAAYRHSDVAGARVEFAGAAHATPGFAAGPWRQEAAFATASGRARSGASALRSW